MATVYRVATSLNPAWGDMTTTTLLSDGSAGDTSTGETSSLEDTSLNVCRYLQANPVLVAQAQLGTIHSVTAASITVTITVALGAP